MTPLRMNGGGTENVWEDGSRRREGGDERGENQIRGRAWQEGGKYRTGEKHTHTHTRGWAVERGEKQIMDELMERRV